jgi:antitoxin component YwqK of YwqJK toxin-antitoxin module
MKKLYGLPFIILIVFAATGCSGKRSGKENSKIDTDMVTIPDTGFTGIKKYKNGELILKEVTFKNGVRDGLTKTFDRNGNLYQTFWYKNDLREDSSCWYYPGGQIFRTTPYKHDTIDGIQRQYYSTGGLRARIGFKKGMRTTIFQEFDRNRKVFHGYPEVVVNIKDEYSSKGLYSIGLELSDKSTKVKFYRGGFTEGRFDTTICKIIKTTNGKGVLTLKKTSEPQPNSVYITADILTPLGNKYLASKKIDLPYNDLK